MAAGWLHRLRQWCRRLLLSQALMRMLLALLLRAVAANLNHLALLRLKQQNQIPGLIQAGGLTCCLVAAGRRLREFQGRRRGVAQLRRAMPAGASVQPPALGVLHMAACLLQLACRTPVGLRTLVCYP